MGRTTSEVPGWYMEFLAAVLRQVPRPGEIDQTTAEGWTDNQRVLREKLHECLLPPKATVSLTPTFPLLINYSLSLTRMIAEGNYDLVNSDITSEHFPIKGQGIEKKVAYLVQFKRDISPADALVELDNRKLRPATIEELLAFGARYGNLQLSFPIIALGTSYDVSGCRYVAYLNHITLERVHRALSLCEWGSRCNMCYRFLAFEK